MCYILCIAVPKGLTGIERYFDARVTLDPLTDEPITSAATGGHPQRDAYALTINGCSCDLLLGGHRTAGRPELIIDGLSRLLDDVPAAAMLNHWFTRPIKEVELKCKGEQTTTMAKFKKLYPKLEEDVRYIINNR